MSYLRNNKPKYFDDGPSAMADSRAMDDSSQILQLFQKTNKRILRLFDAKQNDANDEDENNTFGIEVLNKSESESETDVDNDKENGDIEIAETQSQEADITPPHNNNPQNRRNGIKSLNIKNLSPIDICTISSEGSKSRITPSVDCFKEPTPRSPIHKKPAIPKPNTSLRRSVFKPNIVSDFENFYCSTPRTGELPHTFQDSMRMSPIRNCSVSTNQEDNLPQLRIRSVAEIHKSILNNGSNNNVAIQTRRNSVNDPSPANIHPKKSLDFAMRRTSVDSTTTKKSKPTSIGSIEPELLQQYEKYVLKTPTKTPMSRTSRSSKSPVSHRSNRLQQISNMDIDSEIFCETVSSKRKSINQTDYRPMNMAETPVQSNNIAQNRESMLVMKNKLAMCETADEDMDVEQTSDEDEGMQVEVVEEPVCNIRSKRPGTPSRIPLPFSQHDPKKKRIVLEKITSNSDNDIANNLSPSLLLSFRNLPTKRRSNEKATDANEITSSQLEEQMSLALPKKKRKKSKEIDSVRKEYGGLVDELRKKNKLRSKVVGPEVRKRTLYSRDSPETSRCLRSSIRENKSVSDIELEVMMNEIHGITPLVTNDKNNAEKEVEEQSETSDNNTEAEVVKETIEDIRKNLSHRRISSDSSPDQEPVVNVVRAKNTKKTREVEVSPIRKSAQKDHITYDSDSSPDQEPVVNVVRAKNTKKKTREVEMSPVRKSTHKDHNTYESDSSPDQEPVVNVVRAKNTKKKTREVEVSPVRKSAQKDHNTYESDSSDDEEPVVNVVRAKNTKKTREVEVSPIRKSAQKDHITYDSDSSPDQEPVVNVVRAKNTKKTREVEVSPIRKSAQKDHNTYDSDSSPDQEPVVNVVRAKNTKKTREVEVSPIRKSAQKDHITYDSDSSSDQEPVVNVVRAKNTKKTRKVEVSPLRKSAQKDHNTYESDSSPDQEPVVNVVKAKNTKKKTREVEVSPIRKSAQKDHNTYDSDSYPDQEPVVNVVRAKNTKKTREVEVSPIRKSAQKDHNTYESDSSPDQEPVVNVVRAKNTKKTREVEVSPIRKSAQKDHNTYDSDSYPDQEPVVNVVRAKNTKKTRKVEVSPIRKSAQKDHDTYESDSFQEQEPVGKKTRSIITAAPVVTKSKVTQNSKYSTIADKLEHQANVEKPQTSSKINARPKPLSKKKFSRVIVQDNVEKPQTRKTKFSRIIVQDDSDDNDNYSLLDEIEERSQVVGSVVSKRKSLNKQKVTRTEEMAVADEFVFKKPDVPTKKLSKRQKFLQKELEGLKIRFDRNLMNSDSDEGIEISDTDLYRVPECERKLRVRHLYSRPYWMQGQHQFGIRYSTLNPMEELKKKNFEKEQRAMHTGGNRVQSMIESCLNLTDRVQLIEEHQVNERNNRDKRSRSKSKEPSTVVTQKAASRKQKSKKQFNESVSTDYGGYSSSTHQCVTSTNQMSTIHEQSDSCSSTTIPEEAAAFANLLSRFGAHRKDDNGSITSESSTRVHSEYFDCAQMEDLNFIEVSEGILFGKYIDSMGCGVIQFKEGKKRDRAKTKKSNIKLFMLCGLLELTVGKKIHILKPMGFMFIRCGISYEMRNIYSGVSMVVFIREDEHVSINSEITSSSSNNKTQK